MWWKEVRGWNGVQRAGWLARNQLEVEQGAYRMHVRCTYDHTSAPSNPLPTHANGPLFLLSGLSTVDEQQPHGESNDAKSAEWMGVGGVVKMENGQVLVKTENKQIWVKTANGTKTRSLHSFWKERSE